MRVLVTGHKGYIGSVLVPRLQAAGHTVEGVDTDLFERCTFVGEPPDIPWRRIDVRDLEREHLAGYEAIVHLAGLSNDPLGDFNPALTLEINYEATIRLARLSREVGVERFVYSSSCSCYGATGDDLVAEDSATLPVTPYGRSKVLSERDLLPLATPDFSPIITRSATIYGVSPRLRFDLVLNNLVAWAYSTGRVLLKSDGTPWRPIVHVEDVCRAFEALLAAPRELVHKGVFNVCRTEENYRIGEIANIVAETVKGSRIEYAEGAGPDERCYRVDGSLLPSVVPEFRPQWNARRGAAELLAAYEAKGVRVEEFEGPRYRRLPHLKTLLESGRVDETLRWRTA